MGLEFDYMEFRIWWHLPCIHDWQPLLLLASMVYGQLGENPRPLKINPKHLYNVWQHVRSSSRLLLQDKSALACSRSGSPAPPVPCFPLGLVLRSPSAMQNGGAPPLLVLICLCRKLIFHLPQCVSQATPQAPYSIFRFKLNTQGGLWQADFRIKGREKKDSPTIGISHETTKAARR